MKISNTGAWQNNSLDGHTNSKNIPYFDEPLSKSIVNLFKNNGVCSLYDFGCGHGLYTKYFIENNFICHGYDGNPYTFTITNGLCNVLDLSIPINLLPLDFVLSLEVGEHIPKQFESNFIQNLHKHNTKGIIVSWAVKGQGGNGHVNEQNNDYIKQQFLDLGYENNIDQEKILRNSATIPWFKNTIMVFTRSFCKF